MDYMKAYKVSLIHMRTQGRTFYLYFRMNLNNAAQSIIMISNKHGVEGDPKDHARSIDYFTITLGLSFKIL